MKERPILFSAPMIRALLAGTKTQTRRVLKLPDGFEFTGGADDDRDDPVNWGGEDENGMWWALVAGDDVDRVLPCPYGQPGDRLWVRETWHGCFMMDTESISVISKCHATGHVFGRVEHYAADSHSPTMHLAGKARPSIHMPRWASRITLEVTGVRVERLQDISEGDAIAEGWPKQIDAGANTGGNGGPFDWYRLLWESINGPGSWAANPWVWVIEFRPADQEGRSDG